MYEYLQFFKKYLSGSVIDIGAGSDPVVEHAEVFDQPQGDANNILVYRKPESYDCVHSSHCLEHMRDPIAALKDWWQLVKPGGYMVTVVPHEDLYEQFNWPSIFNNDHKATFRIGKDGSWSPVSIDILKESEGLKNAEVVEHRIYDENYNYGFTVNGDDMTVQYCAGSCDQTCEDQCVADGDATQDSNVNVSDIILVVNHIIGSSVLSDSAFCSSDMNGDGTINVTDIIAIVNLIIGL